jgi:DNA polymerase-4
MERAILLADMNAFFASVHQAVDPRLRGKPVIVAGDPEKRQGIVLTASYEAKHRGIITGMPVWQARAFCPDAVFVKPEYYLYTEFSSRILGIMRDFTPLVEPFSIDEAFMDVSGCRRLFGPAEEIARALKKRVRSEVGITCSVGVAPNKLLAKMAAELQKPDGLTVLGQDDVPGRLWPLPVSELFGVGRRYQEHLRKLNIHTIGELANYPMSILKRKFGLVGEVLWLSANGLDSSPVDPHSLDQVKSIGQQITLPRDYRGNEIRTVILELSDLIAYRLRKEGYVGKTVVLTLRDTNLTWLSRMQTIPEMTNLAPDLSLVALSLLKKHWSPKWPVRLVGITAANLVSHRIDQLSIFSEKERLQHIELACDRVRDRYGKNTIVRGVSLIRGPLHHVRG